MQRRRTAAARSGSGASRKPRGRSRADDATAIERATPRSVARYDGYVNRFTGHGTARDRRTATRFRGDIVTDDEALDLWATEFLAARIIEAMPEEAYRRGWHIKLKDEELAEEVWNWADELGVEQAIIDAWEKENALGGAAIFPVVDGAQGDLSEPLDWDAISTVSALHVLEPRELMPMAFYEDLRSPHYGMPSLYMFTPVSSGFGSTIGMQMIHASRLVVFPGLRVTRQAMPGQRLGWGISRLSRPKGVLADFGLAWGSAATLLHEHGFGVLEMDGLADIMAREDGEEIVWRRVSMMMMMKSSLRALLVSSKDKYTRQTSALSGLAEVLNEFKVLMSAASDGMPVSVLMGQSQSGLRTGDDDVQTWYGNVEKRRSKRIRPRHAELLKFLLLAGDGPTGGREPDAWSIEYPALWSPSEKEVAETRKIDMDRAVAAVSAGIVSGDDVAESFYGSDRYTGDIRINWERRKAQAAIDRERAEDLSEEDRAAMGRDVDPELGQDDDEELSDDDRADLEELEDEFGGDDEPEEDEDDEPEEDEDENSRDDALDSVWRLDGPGYNPYRGKGGKFAPGPHKLQPKIVTAAAVGVERAAGKVRARSEKLATAKAAKRIAVAKARAAIRSAKAAAVTAKKEPTAKNMKAAQVATNKATRAAASVAKHDAAVAKHTEAHARAKAVHTEAKAKLQDARAEAKNGHSMSDAAYARWQHKAVDGNSKLLNSERGALLDYSGPHYAPINAALRKGEMPTDWRAHAVERLDSALAKSSVPKDLLVYRGLRDQSLVSHLKPGAVFRDHGFLSTTISKNVANDSFADGGVLFHITIPKGGKALPMTRQGHYNHEKEVLLPRGSRLRVRKVERNENGTIIVHARVQGEARA